MNVKLIFLNEDLDEKIYMEQLEIFIEKGKENQLVNLRNLFITLNKLLVYKIS